MVFRDEAGRADLYRISQRLGIRDTGKHQHFCPRMVPPDQPGSLEPAALPRKVHIKKADVGIICGDGCDSGGGIGGHGEHLMTARL